MLWDTAHLRLLASNNLTTNSIGIYFSNTLVSGIGNPNPLPFSPQILYNSVNFITDTLGWTLVSGEYTAIGGENYLIIGNFNNDLSTPLLLINNTALNLGAYFYIDDVSLAPCSTITSNNELADNLIINIYPNPFTDMLYVTTSNNATLEITLFDIASNKLLQKIFSKSISLNTQSLERGIYLYQIKSKNGLAQIGKIIKE